MSAGRARAWLAEGWSQVNGIAPQFPVRFRLHLQGPQIMKRFFPWEIKLAEEKQDENTEPR